VKNVKRNDYLTCRGRVPPLPAISGRRGSLPLLMLVLVLFAPSSWARNADAVNAFNDGVKAFNAKQFNEAIQAFDKAIYNDNEFVEALFARGACKYYLKSFDGALMDLNDALRLKPDYSEARALRGALNYERDQWDDALDDFNKVIAANPKDAQSLLGRAVILLKREKLDDAARDFKAFLAIRPDDPLAPKVRQLLASLKGSAPAKAAPAARATSQGTASAEAAPRRPAPNVRALSPEEIQALAESLVSHRSTNSYNQKVLHGERAEATGDSPQIVEPK
jgi:tetratricopeptide (TPR) repeat protein